MIATQDITFGVTGQSLVFDCEDGPITSVTSVTVFYADADDTSNAITATTGSASVDSVSTTAAAAAGASETDPTAIALTSATGVAAGRVYRISKLSKSEDVEIVAVSGATVYTRTPLINDYATGATFIACRATIAVDSTFVASLQYLSASCSPNPRYRSRWLVVVAGATQVYDRQFDLVRYPARHGVTPSSVDERYPGWLDSLPTDRRVDQGRSLIARAFQRLKMDLYRDNKADTAFRDSMVVSELVIARTMLLRMEDAAQAGAPVDAAAYQIALNGYSGLYDGIVRAPFVKVDLTGGGGTSSNNRPTSLVQR